MLETVSRSPVRVRDLADLLRSAADEWERHLVRSAFRPVMLLGIGYAVLGIVWMATSLAAHVFMRVTGDLRYGFGLDPGFIASVPTSAILFLLPIYAAGLLVNTPLFLLLRSARRRVPVTSGRIVAAVGLVTWGEWTLFQMEWFDVWRHGLPGLRYWMTVLVPSGIAWASAGAVIGAGLVGDSGSDAAQRALWRR